MIVLPIAMGLVGLFLSLPAGIFFGRQGIEKLMTALALPVGLVWLLVTAWMLLCWFQPAKRGRWTATLLWIVITLLTTSPLPVYCMNRLETKYSPFDPQQHPGLDVVVVLGGGTRYGPRRAEAASSGDRVLYAAQIFLQGECQKLITTGTAANALLPGADHPYEQTLQIWLALGIPEQAISTLPGQNTYEEIQNLKKYLAEFPSERVGLLTSAGHLPRAMRLAQKAGLEDLIPIAANHTATSPHFSISFFLPSAQNLEMMATVQREWMGQLIGR